MRFQLSTKRFVVPVSFILLISLSCEQPFDPRAPLDKQIVLYALLSTDRNEQYVRVERNYMPEGFDPTQYTSDASLADAIVTIKDPSRLFVFRDTVLPRSDTARYKFPMKMFVLSPFDLQHNTSYSVLAQSRSLGMAYSTVVIPGTPILDMAGSTWNVLSNPISRNPRELMEFTAQLSLSAKGYIGRLYIYYDVLKGSEWVEERVELPLGTWNTDPNYYGLDLLYYPGMTASPSTGLINVSFKNGFLQSIIKQRTTVQYKDNKIVYKWVTFVVLQADQNLFSYHMSTQETRDPRSIRLDEPLYSRVNGGLGFVGAYTLDSLLTVLPENFPGNRQ